MINERLKQIREKMGMNMREFARFLDVKYTTYTGYENGSREPGSDFLALVAKYCQTTTDYILGLTDDDEMLPQPQIMSFTGEDPLKMMLGADEYAMLRAFQKADDRARADALTLLEAHQK